VSVADSRCGEFIIRGGVGTFGRDDVVDLYGRIGCTCCLFEVTQMFMLAVEFCDDNSSATRCSMTVYVRTPSCGSTTNASARASDRIC
jgi:hypothetical protein